VQFSSCNSASNMSFWALQELLEIPTCTSPRLTRLCLVKGVVHLGDFVKFARRQPKMQEIVLSDSVILQHGQSDQRSIAMSARLYVTRKHTSPIRLEFKEFNAQIEALRRVSQAGSFDGFKSCLVRG
jgi:hypothetical protein